MNDFLDIFGVVFAFLCSIVAVVASICGIVCILEYNACPKGAEMYNTEYKFILGTCYFKYDDKWISASKYNQALFINSLNVNDDSKTLLIKNIDK